MRNVKPGKERLNLNSCQLVSLCHSLIKKDDEELDHLINSLNSYYNKHGTKNRLSYNRCCNCFTTAHSDNHQGHHNQRNPLSLKYLLDAGNVTRESLSRFIEEQGWKVKDLLVYPGWEISCKDYRLAQRFQFYGKLHDSSKENTQKGDIAEDIDLRKKVNEIGRSE